MMIKIRSFMPYFCFCTILIIIYWTSKMKISRFVLNSEGNKEIKPNKFTMLVWTPHILNSGKNIPPKALFWDCPYKNCALSYNKTMLNQSSLILFEWAAIYKEGIVMPPRQYQQFWVFFTAESPARDALIRGLERYPKYRGLFNLTMTYRLDSSIPMPYSISDLQKRKVPRNMSILRRILKKKTKIAAWYVSNRLTDLSGRNTIVKKLIQYGVQVDVFGKHEKYKCPKKNYKCIKKLETNYKFYLAFENSNCKDYITEKLFKVLPIHVVPVVLGGGNYRSILPKEAYIDVADFKSIKELARYLISLDKDDEKYLEYLSWRLKYSVQDHKGWGAAFCNACKKLNEGTLRSDHKTTTDLEKWWYKDQCLYDDDRFNREMIDNKYGYH